MSLDKNDTEQDTSSNSSLMPIHSLSIKLEALNETFSLFANGVPKDITTLFTAINGISAEPDINSNFPELIHHLSSTAQACHPALNDLTLFQRLLSAKLTMANLLLCDTLECQVLASNQQDNWLALFQIEVEDLIRQKK
jgi:hypothetical protein